MRVCGAGGREQLLFVVMAIEEIQEIQVGRVMRHEALTVREDATLRALQALFGRWDIGVLPVVGRDERGRMRRLLGVATRSDLLGLLMKATSRRDLERLWEQPVSSVVRPVEPLRAVESLARAAEVLLEGPHPALPVVDAHGHVVGSLALADVLAHADGTLAYA